MESFIEFTNWVSDSGGVGWCYDSVLNSTIGERGALLVIGPMNLGGS